MVTWRQVLMKKVQEVEKNGQNGDMEVQLDEKSSES